jgi:hypothetical protein
MAREMNRTKARIVGYSINTCCIIDTNVDYTIIYILFTLNSSKTLVTLTFIPIQNISTNTIQTRGIGTVVEIWKEIPKRLTKSINL